MAKVQAYPGEDFEVLYNTQPGREDTGTSKLKVRGSDGALLLGTTVVSGGVYGATITVGAETGGNTINVAIQLNDQNGAALAERASILAYVSDDANGDSVTATATSGGVAVGTDGLAIPLVANKCLQLTSESDGDIDLDFVEAGAGTWYLILVMPNGKLVASDAITFAA